MIVVDEALQKAGEISGISRDGERTVPAKGGDKSAANCSSQIELGEKTIVGCSTLNEVCTVGSGSDSAAEPASDCISMLEEVRDPPILIQIFRRFLPKQSEESQINWNAGYYRLYRLALGLYLAIHFWQLLPWCVEMFSNQGCLTDAQLSPLIHLFPNILGLFDSPSCVSSIFVCATLLSLLLALGIFDRGAAIGLWYVWACIYGRNPFIFNPALAYVGIMLIAHALTPCAGPLWQRRPHSEQGCSNAWYLPWYLTLVVWILMAAGYSYSGLTKLASPSWMDGSAVFRVLQCPLSQPGIFRDALLAAPPAVLIVVTYGALALECLFVPMSLLSFTRPLAWGSMLVMHICLIGLIDFADLSVSMILLHAITFEPQWLTICSRWWHQTAKIKMGVSYFQGSVISWLPR